MLPISSDIFLTPSNRFWLKQCSHSLDIQDTSSGMSSLHSFFHQWINLIGFQSCMKCLAVCELAESCWKCPFPIYLVSRLKNGYSISFT
jgi:hypothetical protein